MSNVEPYEIIAAPFTLWWAPTGEAFPAIDAAPAGNWAKLGTSGDRNYSNDGVTVSHAQTIEKFRPLGATGPVKVQRTEEDLMVRLTLWDMTLEHYRMALNNNAVATTAAGSGTAGYKEVPIYRGVGVTTFALLVRGSFSPYGADWNAQYEVPAVHEAGSPETVFVKNAPAGLALSFEAIEDPNAATDDDRFGRLLIQHAAAL